MSNKRHREETSEQVHTRHKKLRDDQGFAKRVDPTRYSFGANINHDSDPFGLEIRPSLPQSEDDDNDIDSPKDLTMNKSSPSSKQDSELGLLLHKLANLEVRGDGNGNGNGNGNDNQLQTCPICSRRVALKEYPDHVHGCLDAMDEGDRHDMRSAVERDSDFASAYAQQHGYVMEYNFICPVCNKQLTLGQSMNEHINYCLDESMKQDEMKKNNQTMNEYDDDDEDDDIKPFKSNGGNNSNSNSKPNVGVMSREQMIECASKLMTLQQGSEQFDNMLDMFGTLGFNKSNVKSVLEIEEKQKDQSNISHNHNNHNHQNYNNMNQNNNNNPYNNNNDNNLNDNFLSPIAEQEEDVDLHGNRNRKSINFISNDNRERNNNNNQQQMNNNQQYFFDDDDL
mmetsp:Transcript_10557/g.9549  ORF Transcript_10557/g.9549 Transcript_10557/m.9549 type:complete len:396 (+) Transcript_10557:62-1249(+)